MIETGTRIICASSSDDLSQIVIFVIILAIGLIGNLTKAKTQKRSGHTGDNRPQRKPTGQRSHARTAPPKPGIDRKPKLPKYYEPGGFAEILKEDDEALEKTLRGKAKAALKKQDWLLSKDEEPAMQSTENTQAADYDLESMGQLETLDSEYSFDDEMVSTLAVPLENQENLAKAVLYSEIISKPVGLRGF